MHACEREREGLKTERERESRESMSAYEGEHYCRI